MPNRFELCVSVVVRLSVFNSDSVRTGCERHGLTVSSRMLEDGKHSKSFGAGPLEVNSAALPSLGVALLCLYMFLFGLVTFYSDQAGPTSFMITCEASVQSFVMGRCLLQLRRQSNQTHRLC